MRFSLFALVLLLVSSALSATQISGDYVETRNADVYTGHCFANGELNLAGDQAILAWRVQNGSWDGVPLAGLSVVAAVKAHSTLGDSTTSPLPAQAVMIVDSRADELQRAALISFAQQQAGELLRHIVRVERAPIALEVGHDHQHHGSARLRAGQFATVETRSLGEKDHVCGNEETYYPPLAEMAQSMAAVAETDQYRGPGLGVSWELHGKRSAFVGTFAR